LAQFRLEWIITAATVVFFSNFVEADHIHILMIKRKHYLSPECDIENAFFMDLICTSPIDGGAEGTDEENWLL
jgi:hypothetical protein